MVGPEDWVFTSAKGGPIRCGNFRNREFAPACKRLGLEGFTFHDLRKFNATVVVSSGVDIKTAQVRLGHADPRLTPGVYALASGEADQRASDSIGRAFNGN
ncbi:MAG: tyrosine-type recombinase/integrase [Actinobacteria bacterium]|nr:tyrosine-type recombinase/integrase [Actinomycetota bacterium]